MASTFWRHWTTGTNMYEYRYQVTKNGQRVGSLEAEYHGRAIWTIDHPDFVDPGEPRTIERLDQALYAAGFEIMPDE
jgi:hypothetical protein